MASKILTPEEIAKLVAVPSLGSRNRMLSVHRWTIQNDSVNGYGVDFQSWDTAAAHLGAFNGSTSLLRWGNKKSGL